MNKAALAEVIGFSEQTLTEWQAEGMPILRKGVRGESHEYDTQAVIRWMLDRAERKVRAQSPRDEYYKAQTQKLQIEIAEKNREMVPAADIEASWASLVSAARRRLLALPGQLAERMEAVQDTSSRRQLLTEEIDAVLRELSEDDGEAVLEDYLKRIAEQVLKFGATETRE